MDERPTGDTRERILAAALDLFVERGYRGTSLREIAERLGLTKAAILYHFPSKNDLLAAIAEPLIDGLEAPVRAAQGLPPHLARWVVIEGWLDVLLAQRRSLSMLFHDLALISEGPLFERIMEISVWAAELISGPEAGTRERVRAVQALAMIGDTVVFFPDVPSGQLREDMLDGARRLYGEPTRTGTATGSPESGLPTAARRRRGRGRPRQLKPEEVATARRMYQGGAHTADDVAAEFGVSRATIYRYLSGSGERDDDRGRDDDTTAGDSRPPEVF